MAGNVDNRIVQMTFDNATFEKKLSDTIASLDKLSAALAEAGGKNGLTELNDSARNFNMNSVAGAVEGVSKKFLALSTIGITVLSNLTTKAVSAGINLVKSLSLTPVLDGFREYELSISSIQTILANTKKQGTDLQDVNAALDELNAYADKTIYNFAEMTRNIGTFTAAGVELDTAVQSIKGIANLAAISGSTSQQASTAMYQLSQAISTGTLRLQDWNSVVNAGMGGQVFQEALFESGKALQTIEGVPIDQTFKEWTDAGNTFRGSLEEGWLTSEVLTTTLQGFTGEMTKQQLIAKGFTAEQAKNIIELGETGVEAATKVRTFTQLLDTAKEALGSGWAASFRIILGDFEQATKLFTGISSALDSMIGSSAEARNKVLKDWAKLGGRKVVIQALKDAWQALVNVVTPLKQAFRDIFPPTTGKDLFQLSERFAVFTEHLAEFTAKHAPKIRQAFRGVFAGVAIGIEILKQSGAAFREIFGVIVDAIAGDGVGSAIKSFSKYMVQLKETLVDDGGIARARGWLVAFFKDPITVLNILLEKVKELAIFETVTGWIEDPIGALKQLGQWIRNLIDRFVDITPATDAAGAAAGRLGQRFGKLRELLGKLAGLWDPFKDALEKVKDILADVWEYIKEWFSSLGEKITEAFGPGDFDDAVDLINVGLLGGVALLIRKFIKKGFSFDGEGLFGKISEVFEELTGVLSAMQAEIRANALLKIAGAIGILTASVLVLSLIDSQALTKSLTAMAVGFGQLIGAFAIINKLAADPKSAGSFTIIATGMIALASALLIMSGAVAILASLDTGQLVQGMAALVVMLGSLVGAVLLLQNVGPSMILVGAGLVGVATSVAILAGAVAIFATMSIESLVKGFASVAAGLLIIAGAMRLMPVTLPITAAGLVLVGIALNAIAASLLIFAQLSLKELGKGLLGVAGSLLIIAGAMHLMPLTLPVTAAGLVLVGAALLLIAKAMESFAGGDWGSIARGLVAMGGALLIIALGTNMMSGAIGGAIALIVVAQALKVLAEVMEQLGGLSIMEIVVALGAIAGVLLVLGLASAVLTPVIPMMAALGAALFLIGGGIALFGLGASLFASAWTLMAKAGTAGAEGVLAALRVLVVGLPEIIKDLTDVVLQFGLLIIEAIPVAVKAIKVLLEQLIETVIELAPDLVEAIVVVALEMIEALREVVPEWIQLGIDLVLALLEGLSENIDDIVVAAIGILTGLIEGLTEGIPDFVEAGAELIRVALVTIAETLGLQAPQILVDVGTALINGLLAGLSAAISKLATWFTEMVSKIINWVKSGLGISSPSTVFMEIGGFIIQGLINGLSAMLGTLMTFVTGIPTAIIGAFTGALTWLVGRGRNIIKGLLDGITEKWTEVATWFGNVATVVVDFFSDALTWLLTKGGQVITGFFTGITGKWVEVGIWLANLPGKIVSGIGSLASTLTSAGADLLAGLKAGIVGAWDSFVGWVKSYVIGGLKDAILSGFGLWSPSRWMRDEVGHHLMTGIQVGMKGSAHIPIREAGRITDRVKREAQMGLKGALEKAAMDLEAMDDVRPTIRPIVDLSEAKAGLNDISTTFKTTPSLEASVTTSAAQRVAAGAAAVSAEAASGAQGDTYYQYEQTINAPKELRTADIYRQTRTLTSIAKDDLEGRGE